MWIVEEGAEGDIEADFLRFYGFHPDELDDDGPRFLRLAERLPHYRGACAARIARLRARAASGSVDPRPAVVAAPISPATALFGNNVVRLNDVRLAAQMTKNTLGVPSTGYRNKHGVKEV